MPSTPSSIGTRRSVISGRSVRTVATGGTHRWTLAGLLVLALTLFALKSCASPTPTARPFELSDSYPTAQRYMGIRLRGAIEILPTEVDGIPLVGLSGLAWDDDALLLYAVSDRGGLFHLRPQFSQGILRNISIVRAVALRAPNGQPLRGKAADAEGLALTATPNGRTGDPTLLIAFEHTPRVVAFDPEGYQRAPVALPPALRHKDRYANPNKALEAVTLHPRWGLLTGPEWPFFGQDPAAIPIFALEHHGFWRYPRASAPDSALVAMEALADGSLLTLERSYQAMLALVTIALRRTAPLHSQPAGQRLPTRDIAVFRSSEGWRVDNFEGLSHHRDRRFFMVSDDNARSLQRTLLVYFEVVDAEK